MNRPAESVPADVRSLLESGAALIADASDTPGLDARIVLQAILNKDHAWLIAHGDQHVNDASVRKFHEWIRRRARSEPLAYITGRKAFWSFELMVTPDVLVPRPETELLVERALEKIPLSESLTVVDLGTGSGAIGLSIASERPLCTVTATDRSRAALKIAERNKGRLGLRNINFRHGDWYEALGRDRYSLIVCNPPYVPDSYYAAALTYEPHEALFSGRRGLDALEPVIRGASAHLEPGGWLLVEHGFDHAEETRRLFGSQEYESINVLNDYAGKPRVTEGRRPR